MPLPRCPFNFAIVFVLYYKLIDTVIAPMFHLMRNHFEGDNYSSIQVTLEKSSFLEFLCPHKVYHQYLS